MLNKISRGLFRITRVKLFFIFLLSVWLLYMHYMKIYKITTGRPLSYVKQTDVKYVLQWTRRYSAPFDFMGESNFAFKENNCKHTNCYVTNDNEFFANVADFDAIAFNGRDVIHLWPFMMPKYRSSKQKYIFGAMESPDNFPACSGILDGFFNWTWTYRLDSDFRWGYITIYDLEDNVVGPKIDMKWPKLKPITQNLKNNLSSKTKAAAWFVSHCSTKSRREAFVSEVQKELRAYGWTVDIYGSCGSYSCPKSDKSACFELIEKNYYFYFSLENSFSEDYVTEKLLTALDHYAVPIVYGSANYSRFLPPGSYLDGRELGPKKLAKLMSEIIGNKSLYYEFFRWRNHFKYKETSSTEDICKLCEMLNNEKKMAEVTVWKDFRTWWNGARYEDNC